METGSARAFPREAMLRLPAAKRAKLNRPERAGTPEQNGAR